MLDNQDDPTKKQVKSYPLKMPYQIWHKARLNAMNGSITLGEYILRAISEKNDREGKE
jgi:hypothetical protein